MGTAFVNKYSKSGGNLYGPYSYELIQSWSNQSFNAILSRYYNTGNGQSYDFISNTFYEVNTTSPPNSHNFTIPIYVYYKIDLSFTLQNDQNEQSGLQCNIFNLLKSYPCNPNSTQTFTNSSWYGPLSLRLIDIPRYTWRSGLDYVFDGSGCIDTTTQNNQTIINIDSLFYFNKIENSNAGYIKIKSFSINLYGLLPFQKIFDM